MQLQPALEGNKACCCNALVCCYCLPAVLQYDNVAVSGSSQHYNTTLLVANTTACEMVNGTVVSTK